MAWYLYIGDTVKPIGIGGGEVIAVRPHTKVEIKSVGPDVARLVAAGKLRLVAGPKVVPVRVPVVQSVASVKEVVSEPVKLPFADALTENVPIGETVAETKKKRKIRNVR
jgi:hypothetical protein